MTTSNPNPLSNHRIYEGTDVDEARETISRLFMPTALEPLPARGSFHASLHGLQLPRSLVCCCDFPDGMVATPAAALDFHAVQLNLSGGVRFDIDEY